METLIARLESVVAQVAGGGSDADGVPVTVSEFKTYYSGSVEPFIAACEACGAKNIGDWTKQAWSHMGVIVEMSTQCAKPSQEALMGQLGPMIEVFNQAGNPKPGDTFNKEKSFAEALAAINWVMADGPGTIVKTALEGAEFYLNKVLTVARDKEDPVKPNERTFVKTLKAMLAELETYVTSFFKMGLSWKIKGIDCKDFVPGQAAAGGDGAAPGLEERLEAAVGALEAYKAKMLGGDGDEAPALSNWKAFHEERVVPFIATAKSLEECKQIGEWTEAAFGHMMHVVIASTECSKPSQEDFMAFLGPIVKVITDSGNPDSRDKQKFPFEKSFNEGIQSLSWIMMDGPPTFINGQLEAAQFYLNKCLGIAKDLDDPTKTAMRNWVKQFKDLMTDMAAYTKDFHKMGMSWKVKDGSALKDYKIE